LVVAALPEPVGVQGHGQYVVHRGEAGTGAQGFGHPPAQFQPHGPVALILQAMQHALGAAATVELQQGRGSLHHHLAVEKPFHTIVRLQVHAGARQVQHAGQAHGLFLRHQWTIAGAAPAGKEELGRVQQPLSDPHRRCLGHPGRRVDNCHRKP
jgi:hypothetical protein